MTVNPAASTASEVVIVVRDHYSSTQRSLSAVLATTPAPVKVVVVAGNMSCRRRTALLGSDPERVRIVGPRCHLVPNVARSIGLTETTGRLVAFIDNDVVVEPGWFEELHRVWHQTRAAAVRPVILQRFGEHGETTVHESGGECSIGHGAKGRSLIDTHEHMHSPLAVTDELCDQPVGLLEFHCVLFDRMQLADLGGFDTTIESQGEHLDATLRIRNAGKSIWLASAAQATVEFARGVRPADFAMFLGRWSPMFNERSRRTFNAKWGITDPDDSPDTWAYAEVARRQVWLPLSTMIHRAIRRSSPAGIAIRIDRVVGRHIADLVVRVAPGWRSWRRTAESLQ